MQSSGDMLSAQDLKPLRDEALQNALVVRAIILAELASEPLTETEQAELIIRCISLGWVSEGIMAAKLAPIHDDIRKQLLQAIVESDLANSIDEAHELLKME